MTKELEAIALGKELDAKIICCCALEQLCFALLFQNLDSFYDDFFGHTLKLCKSKLYIAFWPRHAGCLCAPFH